MASVLSYNTNMMAANVARNLSTHYGDLSNSVRRLSSGLRVSTAADDAAGLAIRELMRADISSLNQGIRNASDAISLIQTADGALGIIDEKLIRMKELAEQAATGTYNSDQRLMIDSEFQAMASEIERIAMSTAFNGIKLLDGSLSGQHDGSGLKSTGELKVHFGAGNDSSEDYYYLNVGDATLKGLGLAETGDAGNQGAGNALWNNLANGVPSSGTGTAGIVFLGIIPAGTKNLSIHLDDGVANYGGLDAIQLFTPSGVHIAGSQITGAPGWFEAGIWRESDIPKVLTPQNGFAEGATHSGGPLYLSPYTEGTAGNIRTYNGMIIGYSGTGFPASTPTDLGDQYLTIDETTEDLILLLPGDGNYTITANWDSMPGALDSGSGGAASAVSIETQDSAQKALGRLDDAIIQKDQIRAHLGATQNRLENTVSNLQIQAENLQAAESRISDVDVAEEMTTFVRKQILTQAAVSMLSQANSMPQMLLSLIG